MQSTKNDLIFKNCRGVLTLAEIQEFEMAFLQQQLHVVFGRTLSADQPTPQPITIRFSENIPSAIDHPAAKQLIETVIKLIGNRLKESSLQENQPENQMHPTSILLVYNSENSVLKQIIRVTDKMVDIEQSMQTFLKAIATFKN